MVALDAPMLSREDLPRFVISVLTLNAYFLPPQPIISSFCLEHSHKIRSYSLFSFLLITKYSHLSCLLYTSLTIDFVPGST